MEVLNDQNDPGGKLYFCTDFGYSRKTISMLVFGLEFPRDGKPEKSCSGMVKHIRVLGKECVSSSSIYNCFLFVWFTTRLWGRGGRSLVDRLGNFRSWLVSKFRLINEDILLPVAICCCKITIFRANICQK